MKFVLALGLSSLGVPLVALIYGSSGSFDGVFWALIACSAIAMAIGIALPRTARSGPADQPSRRFRPRSSALPLRAGRVSPVTRLGP